MRQFPVIAEPHGLDAVDVVKDELLILGRTAWFFGPGAAIQYGHGDRLDLVLAETEPITQAEARHAVASLHAGQHFGFRHLDFTRDIRLAGYRMRHRERQVADAKFPQGRMDVAIAAHAGIGQGQHPAGLSPRQGLQAWRCGKPEM